MSLCEETESVRSECQEHLLKRAPCCSGPLIKTLWLLSFQCGCFYFINNAFNVKKTPKCNMIYNRNCHKLAFEMCTK